MRRWMTALLVAAATGLAACEPAPRTPAAGEPALWRIADEDSEIWLFGSVHVLPADVHWLSPRIAAALDSADEFVTETNTDDADFPGLAAQYGTLPEGQTLSSLLSAEDAARLARVAGEVNLDMAQVERMRPWLAALNITYLYAARAGHSIEAGVETVLGARARAAGKRFGYLETAEAQIRVLADLAPVDEAHFLAVTVRQLEDGPDQLSALDEPWARGDLATLSERLDADWAEAGPAVHEAVIIRRNRNWADQIEERLAGAGSAFITVGAAHLVGEENVVRLLRERGIEVEGP